VESKLKYSIANQKIEVRASNEGEIHAFFAGRKLFISEVVEPSKLSIDDQQIKKKMDIIVLAEELGNISEASRKSGVSRPTIYKYKKILKEKGREALKRTIRKDHYHGNRASKDLEKTIVDFDCKSSTYPTFSNCKYLLN